MCGCVRARVYERASARAFPMTATARLVPLVCGWAALIIVFVLSTHVRRSRTRQHEVDKTLVGVTERQRYERVVFDTLVCNHEVHAPRRHSRVPGAVVRTLVNKKKRAEQGCTVQVTHSSTE